jgi:tetraacyldisaccharide 4'-kinase
MPRLQRVWAARGPWVRLLLPLSWIYRSIWRLRALLYRTGVLRTERLPVPVVIVGNLIAGGAGKTPAVRAVVELLQRHGRKPGIVSRGYGRRDHRVAEVEADSTAQRVGDEPLLLRLRSAVPVVVGRDRPDAARELLRRHREVDVIVSDDGLQHLALARDVSVIVFDERGAGNGCLLPAGPLREPMPRAVGPATLVLYNAPSPSTRLPGFTATRALRGAVELAHWWAGEPALPETLRALTGRRLVAAAGIAQPERFFEMLRSAGLEIETLALPDHHGWQTLPWPAGTSDAVITEKDAVKLDAARVAPTRVWVVALDFRPAAGFAEQLLQLLPPAPLTPTEPAHGHSIA